jgi:pimeloyl-ACP methyl ester carboxylesterase
VAGASRPQDVQLRRAKGRYEDLEDGPPAVLVHGTPFSSFVWRRIARDLARRHGGSHNRRWTDRRDAKSACGLIPHSKRARPPGNRVLRVTPRGV